MTDKKKHHNSELLSLSNLIIGYGTKHKQKVVASGLEGILKRGELICLLGSNGTGKSTLMRTICGFIPKIGGHIVIDKCDTTNITEKQLAKTLSVVLTDRVVVPNATVTELVGYGRSPYTGLMGILQKNDIAVVEQTIDKCGMSHKKHQLISTLSDGERQRAFIAKALAQDTPLILLDEPTAFLDLQARVEVFQLLRRIASLEGKSILLSTHDLDLALQMADRLWLLFPSGPLMSGSPEDLLYNNTFQQLFIHQGIEFDNKTGLFNICHNETRSLALKGHGFEYVLLRRAFARKGIRLEKYINQDVYIDLTDASAPFILRMAGRPALSCRTIEPFVAEAIARTETKTTSIPTSL